MGPRIVLIERSLFLLMDKSGERLGFIKYPLFKNSEHFIKNEYNSLDDPELTSLSMIQYPRASKIIHWENNLLLFQKDIFNQTKQIGCELNLEIVKALVELAKIKKNPCEYSILEKNIKKIFMEINLEKPIFDKIKDVIRTMKLIDIPFIKVHGDFIAYNIQTRDNKLYIVDWEFARFGLPLFDLFHFLFQGLYQVRKYPVDKIVSAIFNTNNSRLVTYYLNQLKISPKYAHELFVMYLLEALNFDFYIRNQTDIYQNHYLSALLYYVTKSQNS